MFPFIVEESFREVYQMASNNGFKMVERTWLILLNMVFALAKSADAREDEPKDLADGSQAFYQRALSLCGPQLVGATTNVETGE